MNSEEPSTHRNPMLEKELKMPPSASTSIVGSKLYLGLQPGRKYGWGICSQYLIKELSNLTEVHVLNDRDGSSKNSQLPGPLFQCLTNENFFPLFEHARGNRNFGYTFFENALTETSVKNSEYYEKIFAGSSWCRDQLREKGVANCDVLIQGVDPEKFYPAEHESETDRFVIFSGGKFELRKGQDLVLKALKIVQDKYKDIILVNCWYNMWPQSMALMNLSPHITFEDMADKNWHQFMQAIYEKNCLQADRIITLGAVPHYSLPEIYHRTDIGLFPNRCEGGTNLVLMEYMACGKPAIVSYASGHTDVADDACTLLLKHLKDYNLCDREGKRLAQWQEPSVDEIVAKIEYAYHHREAVREIGQRAGERMKSFTWQASARHLMQRLMH